MKKNGLMWTIKFNCVYYHFQKPSLSKVCQIEKWHQKSALPENPVGRF